MKNKVLEEIITNKDKTKVFDKYNIIFIYMLKDAFNNPLRTIYVDENSNLHLINNIGEEIISSTNTNELNNVLSKHEVDFEDGKKIQLPRVNVLDGYVNEVYFKVNNNWHNDSINNMYYYDGNDLDTNKHLSEVIILLDDVYEVLYKYNKQIEEYFILCEKEEDTE